ncbi:MAG: dihydropteroate synthase [Thiomargarita sp.]|nr:dihydropteroate synthase [Thiomargarita sp.]
MGIINVTPDSFSDGGKFFSTEQALNQARLMIGEGVDIIDVGGESTRPGAKAISVQEELDRVIPVLEKIRAESVIKLSIDTSKAQVIHHAIQAGANIVNDVTALQGENSLATIAQSNVQVCLMHMQGKPRSMQQNPHYNNLIEEISQFLSQRIQICLNAGIKQNNLIIDPGFGFGKTLEHNLLLMKNLQLFTKLNCPILVGVSRKSMVGTILNKPVAERLYGSLALAVLAVTQGANIIRTHDVTATVDALKVVRAVIDG